MRKSAHDCAKRDNTRSPFYAQSGFGVRGEARGSIVSVFVPVCVCLRARARVCSHVCSLFVLRHAINTSNLRRRRRRRRRLRMSTAPTCCGYNSNATTAPHITHMTPLRAHVVHWPSSARSTSILIAVTRSNQQPDPTCPDECEQIKSLFSFFRVFVCLL